MVRISRRPQSQRAARPPAPDLPLPAPAGRALPVCLLAPLLALTALGAGTVLGIGRALPRMPLSPNATAHDSVVVAASPGGSSWLHMLAPAAAAAMDTVLAAPPPPSPTPAPPAALPRCCCMGVGPTGQCWPPPAVSGGRPYTILWHSNQFGPRGTEISMFDYAASFEEYLCGDSHVMTFGSEALVNRMPYPDSMISLPKFQARFPGRVHLLMRNGREEVDEVLANISADAFYATQYGTVAGTVVWPTPSQGGRVRTLLHAVFDGNEPHYDGFAVIGDTIPRAPGVPVVHYISYVNPDALRLPGLRAEWGVPPSARVFCRHGGPDTFDIAFVRQAVCDHAAAHPADYFVLLGTAPVACDGEHANIIHLPKSVDMAFKQRYLNSCSACLHARSDGETFGLGVAECSMSGLPVMTYCAPPSAASFHLQTLGKEGLLYCSAEELGALLVGFDAPAHAAKREVYAALYAPFGPSAIMLEFMQNFQLQSHFLAVVNPSNMSWQGKCEPIISLAEA